MSGVLVLDYGSGNVESVFNAMRRVSDSVSRSSDVDDLARADAVVIPGVGAFPAFMASLERLNLVEPVRAAIAHGMPALGICVGMQAMGRLGMEHEPTPGLALTDGTVESLRSLGVLSRRVPHVGWNDIRLAEDLPSDSPLRVLEDRDVYFMHSFAYPADAPGAVGWTDYETEFCSVIQKGPAMGIQFHPEKSQRSGLDFLHAWVRSAGSS